MMSITISSIFLSVVLAAAAAPGVVEKATFKGLPRAVCADLKTTELCKDRLPVEGKPSMKEATSGPSTTLPLGAGMPLIVCEVPGAGGPCDTKACGDGICSFGEMGQCGQDCPLPAELELCVCDKPPCTGYKIACTAAAGCSIVRTSPDAAACTCSGPGGSMTCKGSAHDHCVATRFDKPISACELTRQIVTTTSSGALAAGGIDRIERCSDRDCAQQGSNLRSELEDLPKTKIGSRK